MHVNVEKTKTMVFARKAQYNDVSICITGTVLENVDSFVYIGSDFTWNDCLRDIRLASRTYSDLQSMER